MRRLRLRLILRSGTNIPIRVVNVELIREALRPALGALRALLHHTPAAAAAALELARHAVPQALGAGTRAAYCDFLLARDE